MYMCVDITVSNWQFRCVKCHCSQFEAGVAFLPNHLLRKRGVRVKGPFQ